MRVLVVNAGSGSLTLFVLDGDNQVTAATVERWEGEAISEPIERQFCAHRPQLEAIGHRVLHGGSGSPNRCWSRPM